MPEKEKINKIEDLRKSTGTHPSENPNRQNKFLSLQDSLEIELVDHNKNPYKAMFLTSTATWGNNEYKNKWVSTNPESKLEVVKAVLTNNTLPQAREMVNFIFRVKGVPRWLFDFHTLNAPFASFMSIGCRDNDKRDADFVFQNHKEISEYEKNTFNELKDLYEFILNKGKGSWQSARSFLPQNYSHSYFFGQNLLSLSNMKFEDNDHSNSLRELYKYIVAHIHNKFPLIALYASYSVYMNKKDILFRISKLKYDELENIDKNYFKEN